MRKVVHFELPADDVARASEFYRSVFDRELRTMPEVDYTSIRTTAVDESTQLPLEPGAINGGLFKRTPQTPVPVVTVDVESIDIALKEVEAAGGITVTPRTEIENMGAFGYFKDTEGNVVGLWENPPTG